MPEDNKIIIDETMDLKTETTLLDDLDELEKRIDQVNPDKMSMRPPLTHEQKIKLLDLLFPIKLGSRVQNKHMEVGYVESVSIDRRGVLYLTRYKDQNTTWETEFDIEDISSQKDVPKPDTTSSSSIVTDIPDDVA
jgi:hypothetical protein